MNFWEEFILKVIPIVITSITAYVAGRANKRADKKDEAKECAIEEMNAMKGGLCSLLRVKIIEYHDRYMKDGDIPHYARENFEDMYSAYHALGGNGTGTVMYNEICNLKSRSEYK